MGKRMLPVLAAVIFVFFVGGRPVYAGPPYETDDPDPTEYRHFEIYLYGDYRHTDAVDATPVGLEVNYGLVPNVQFSVTFPEAYTPICIDGHANNAFGMGPIEVALKYRFLQETQSRPEIALYPAVTLATQADRDDVRHGTLQLPVWAQKSVGKWTFFGGGGPEFNWDGVSRLSWFGGLAATYDITEQTNVGVEIARNTMQDDTPGETDIGVGIIHNIGKFHDILSSVGRSLNGGTFHAYVAYGWRLGPNDPAK